MTPSDKLILIETRAMAGRVLEITDTVEFHRYVHGLFTQFGIGSGHLERLTGIEGRHIINRKRAVGGVLAERNGSAGYPEEFKPFIALYDGVKLNHDDHGSEDWQPWTEDWWLTECPARWSDHVLRQAHDNAARVPWIAALYLEHDQRLPDQVGFEYWTELVAEGKAQEDVRGWIIDGFAK